MESETRIKAREALLAALDGEPTSSDKLIAVANDIRNLAQKGFSLESITREYSLYAGFLEAAARLSSWTKAVRSCEADADRFLRGAKVLVRDHVQAFQPEKDEMWTSCSDLIEKLSEVGDVPAIYKAVLSIPLPIAHPVQHRRRAPVEVGEKKEVHKVLVAFTSFSVNGEPFQQDHLLNLDIGYDLQVEVGLSTWPEDESELHIEPLSVEPADSYELPSFSFLKPQVAGALSLKATKRMILKRANSFLARPLEFAYRARFPSSREITTEGQRHLSVRCFDPKKDPVSGYSLEEIVAMLDVLPEPSATAVATAAFTGLRLGELRGLTWESYEPAQDEDSLGWLNVTRSVCRNTVGDPKTAKSKAPVPVIPQLAQSLDNHRKRRGNPLGGPMFANSVGHPLDLNACYQREMKDVLKRAGISWHGWHGFRRGLASNLNRLGVDDSVIQRILRHSSVATTQNHYIKTASPDAIAAMRQFSEALLCSTSAPDGELKPKSSVQ